MPRNGRSRLAASGYIECVENDEIVQKACDNQKEPTIVGCLRSRNADPLPRLKRNHVRQTCARVGKRVEGFEGDKLSRNGWWGERTVHGETQCEHEQYGDKKQRTSSPASEKQMAKARNQQSPNTGSGCHSIALGFEKNRLACSGGETLRPLKGRVRRVILQHHCRSAYNPRIFMSTLFSLNDRHVATIHRVRGALLSLFVFILWTSPPAAATQKAGQPEIRVPTLERRIHDLINKERTAKKLRTLQFDEKLSSIARAHSADMARRKFFSHVNPDGKDPTARGELAGYRCKKDFGSYFTEGLAENLYQGNLYSSVRTRGTVKTYTWNTLEDLATQSVTGWMKSKGHRENILEKSYDKTGIGVAISKDDKVFVTQVFC